MFLARRVLESNCFCNFESLGMVSLVNAARVSAGKGGLGWINPAIYQYSSHFANDVTSGNNNCVEGGTCCTSGFTAKSGWDPVTGWGSVNFANFKSFFVGLGNQLNIPTLSPSVAPAVVASTPKPSATAMPSTSNTGWMYKYTYNEKSCVGSVINVLSVPLGVCLHYYSYVGTSLTYGGYQMYSCNNGWFLIINFTFLKFNKINFFRRTKRFLLF